jgi:hypothetical protein
MVRLYNDWLEVAEIVLWLSNNQETLSPSRILKSFHMSMGYPYQHLGSGLPIYQTTVLTEEYEARQFNQSNW